MDLDGKQAVITGGTSGIGSETAVAMAAAGASVTITGRNSALGEQVTSAITSRGGKARFLSADLSRTGEVRRLAREAGETDILVNCAGDSVFGATGDVDEAAFDRVFAVNVKAPFFLVGALAPAMAARGGGTIINLSTMVAGFGQPGMSAYGASRAAVELLTKAWAAEYGPRNIRVNAVAPGPIATPAAMPNIAMAEQFARQIPLQRVGQTHEVSDVIVFLATPGAGYINGAIIRVDGGRTAI